MTHYKKTLLLFVLGLVMLSPLQLFAQSGSSAEPDIQIKYKYAIYENKSLERIKNIIFAVKDFYFWLQGEIFSQANNELNLKEDINFIKFKKNFEKEIAFIKGLKTEKGIELSKEEKETFFFVINRGKIKHHINTTQGEVFEQDMEITKGRNAWQYKVIIDTSKGRITTKKEIDGTYVNKYSGKIAIPKNTKIYKIGNVVKDSTEHVYMVIWFYTSTGLWSNILSISWWNDIELISNVTGLFINKNEKYNFEIENCYPDHSYLHIQDNSIKFYCLDKKDHSNIREINIIN